jgi:hypothetical protein
LAKHSDRHDVLERVPVSPGPAGPIPRADYCTPQCYAKDKRNRSKHCLCKGCGGDAHGRGKKYAFDHGYLKYSPLGSRKPKSGQESLFPEENTESDRDVDPT